MFRPEYDLTILLSLLSSVGRTARAGRQGLAISIFRFPRDLEFLAAIEEAINTKLTEHPIDQEMVKRIFMQVNVSKRECEMQLDNNDFDERAQNYRRKQWIEDGKDPDEMEKKWLDAQKAKKRERKKAQREFLDKKEAKKMQPSDDDRFKNVNAGKFDTQPKNRRNPLGLNKKSILIEKHKVEGKI